MIPRSLLFVPGNRPERFAKAVEAGADLVCIDLEDAVAPDAKADAREAAAAFLREAPAGRVGVRVNAPGTQEVEADLVAIQGLDLPFVMVPKVDRVEELDALDTSLSLMPVIESGMGMLNARDLFAHPRVRMVLFGGGDYSADLGAPMSWEAFQYARSHLAACGAAYEVAVFDVPYLDVHDAEGGEADTKRVAGLGIHSRAAIHPKQVAAIHAAYTPSEDEVAAAFDLRAAYEASGGNAALHKGKLIEAPMLRAAERILERAETHDGR